MKHFWRRMALKYSIAQPKFLQASILSTFVRGNDAWANSDAGQVAKVQNPLGFANVRAHAAAHLAALQNERPMGSSARMVSS